MKKRITLKRYMLRIFSVFMTVVMLLPCFTSMFSVQAVDIPTDASVYAEISTICQRCIEYDRQHYGCLAWNGYTSFRGWCAHYVHIQLMLLGINNNYISGDGKDEFNNYQYKTYSEGGRKIHAYDARYWSMYDALTDISSQCRISTGILLGFERTCTTSGQMYGHAMLIHAIIDGNVYFTENFDTYIGGVTYTIGSPIKCSIEDFCTYYARPSVFGLEGIIWFEDEALTAAVNGGEGGGSTPGGEEGNGGGESGGGDDTPETVYTAGMYRITYSGGMRLRSEATTDSETLTIIPGYSTVYVTEINGSWGKVFCNVSGTYYDGWMNLGWSERTGDLPPVAAESYSGSRLMSRQWYSSLYDALSDRIAGSSLTLYADCTVDRSVTIDEGVTLNAGSHTLNFTDGAVLQVRGGTVTADSSISVIENDPFVTATDSGGKITYTCRSSLEINEAGLVIRNGTCVRFMASADLPASASGLTYELVSDGFGDSTETFAASSVTGSSLEFITDAVPAEYMSDRMTVYVRLRKTVNGVTYSIESDEVSFSPASYVGSIYGTNKSLDGLLAASVNYATALQKLNNAPSSEYSNLVLPEADRQVSTDDSYLVEALEAPSMTSASSVKISSAQLTLDGSISMKFGASGSTEGTKLLVFTASRYNQLKNSGGSIAAKLTESNASAVITPDSNGNYIFSDFTAKQYADTYYFRLVKTDSSGTHYDSVFTFSVTEYCRRLVSVSSDGNIINLCRAICEYSAEARKCFGYTING